MLEESNIMIQEADINGDGIINLSEFCQLMDRIHAFKKEILF
ncbi:hypothetical protein MXB_5517 [Myxobolus squamalis]|nr:hypothetical protein MXB_5517 [Myxobolus squamalis]